MGIRARGHTFDVTQETVRSGDVLMIGGTPHQIVRVERHTNSLGTELRFTNGSVYTLPPGIRLTVTRAVS